MIDLLNLMDKQTVKTAKVMKTVSLQPALQTKPLEPAKDITNEKKDKNLQAKQAQSKPLLLTIKPSTPQLSATAQPQTAPILSIQPNSTASKVESSTTLQGESSKVEQVNKPASKDLKDSETLKELKALQETVRLQVSNMKYLLETIEGLEEDVDRLKKEEPLD